MSALFALCFGPVLATTHASDREAQTSKLFADRLAQVALGAHFQEARGTRRYFGDGWTLAFDLDSHMTSKGLLSGFLTRILLQLLFERFLTSFPMFLPGLLPRLTDGLQDAVLGAEIVPFAKLVDGRIHRETLGSTVLLHPMQNHRIPLG